MKISDLIDTIKGRLICGEEKLNNRVEYAFSSDLMSDVLTITQDDVLLITGLVNIQTIRTAEMADISYILFVRNKKVSNDIIKLAKENSMVLIECESTMFKASGLLFNAGLKPVY